MPFGNTLNQLSIGKAKTFVNQVDNITENAPVVKAMPFVAASDQLWDVSSEVQMVGSGMNSVDLNAPLQEIQLADALKQTQLNIFGAKMFVPEDTAKLEGGPDKYFGKNRQSFERQTGMDVERNYIYNAFLPFALAQYAAGHTDCVQNAGGSGNTNYSLVVVRFDNTNMTGLYSPLCFKRDTFLDMSPINGGNLYENGDSSSKYYKVLGYGLRMKTYMGVRMLSYRNISAIVNIKLSAATPLTKAMVEKALLGARVGEAGKAMILCHPKVKLCLADIGKVQYMQSSYPEKGVDFRIDTWDGVPIVTSYNFVDGAETDISLS